MNYPLSKKSSLSRFLSLSLVMVMVLTMLSGCSLIPGLTKATEPSTDPTVEDTTANQPNIIEETETTEPPTTETTAPPTTEAKKENVAVVKEQISIRSSPSTGSRVITQLDAGDEVEVLRIEPIGTVNWAYVSSDSLNVMGWIVTEMLDMSNVQLSAGSTSTPASDPTGNAASTQPTTPTVNNITGTGNSTTPANSQVGTVNTNTLNIRSSASTNGERVGQYTYGDRITILETSNGWGRTDKGWVSLNYVTMQQSSSTATITGSTVNIRSGAGTNNGVVGAYNRGDSVTILETTTVGNTQWGRTDKGWISMDYVSTNGSAPAGNTGSTAGNTTAPAAGTATVTGSGLNIRTGAGTNYESVGVLKQGDVITVLETATVGNSRWGRTDRGWICLDYVRMN